VRKLGGYVVDEEGEKSGGRDAVIMTVRKVRGEIRRLGLKVWVIAATDVPS